jgi:RNA polymerase sigma-70 factor (ECF subfamily)
LPNNAQDRDWEKELPDLMARYQQAEPDAVSELIRLLSPPLVRYFAVARISPGEVEDLFQECWMRIHSSRHTYRPPAPVLPWVFAIARHTHLDGYRRRMRRQSREVLVADPPEVQAQPQRKTMDDDARFARLLESLPASQREILMMLKVSGMSLEEVARATFSTVGSIKQKVHRAYAKLRLVLKSDGGTDGH